MRTYFILFKECPVNNCAVLRFEGIKKNADLFVFQCKLLLSYMIMNTCKKMVTLSILLETKNDTTR